MLTSEHLGGFLAGLAALVTAVISPIVMLIVNARQTRKQSDQLKGHMEAQVRKANGVPFAFIENLPVPAWCKSVDGRMLWINYEYSQQWGLRPSDCEGKFDSDVWPAEVAQKFREHDLRVIHDRVTLATTEMIPEQPLNAFAARRLWNVRKFPVINSSNQVVAVGGLAWLPTDNVPHEDTATVRVQ